jgi:ketopantoate reductase
MRKEKIAVIGVGGRTGTMFAFELGKAADVLGIARAREAALIKGGKLSVVRGKERKEEEFRGRVIEDRNFGSDSLPDVLFFATKNPVGPPIEYYCRHYKGREKPTLIISQNGIAASKKAVKTVRAVFGDEADRVRIVRVVLFNPIGRTEEEHGSTIIHYSLPLKGALAQVSGPGGIEDIVEVFKEAGLHFREFPPEKARDMEFSKLFLNLIGMAAASRGASITEGFGDKETFKEEAVCLKEYVGAVRALGCNFVNFPGYPVRTMADFLFLSPLGLLTAARNLLARVVSKGREGKPKVLDEIEYYNGGVVTLGRETGFQTPVNEKVYQRALKLMTERTERLYPSTSS